MAKQQRAPGSWGPLPLAVMQDERLTTADKAVYAAIVVVAHGRPKCEISRPLLSRLSSTSISTVARSLSNLEGSGWVNLVTAPGKLTMALLPVQGDPTTPLDIKGVSQLPYSGVSVDGSRFTVNHSSVMAESDANPHREREVENREAVANAPFKDEDPTEALERRLRQLEDQLSSSVRETYGFPHPSSEDGADPEPDIVLFRDALRGNAPRSCLASAYVVRQFDLFKAITDPKRIDEILTVNKFYRDPSKPGGWGMKDAG